MPDAGCRMPDAGCRRLGDFDKIHFIQVTFIYYTSLVKISRFVYGFLIFYLIFSVILPYSDKISFAKDGICVGHAGVPGTT